ncbi:MAG: SDR family oxidoreductase [Elusimicrobia bacterium]|nr:SDR family oxidoreductase [Elusimicrobiota bacterium]MBD3412468.1 SDR family oxidoreductase [Elusimicrobiota bacterium]
MRAHSCASVVSYIKSSLTLMISRARTNFSLIPSKHAGYPSDIDPSAVWLASDESDYVDGTKIFVDGGMMLYPGFATGG